jgi:hypothetical protein
VPDFPIWPQCNIGCVFCSNPVEGYRHTTDKYSYEEIRKKVFDYKRGLQTFVKFDEVGDYFNLTGGEPTLHPDFLRILALIRIEFPQNLIRLLTNGRTLAEPGFARRVCGVGGLPFEVAVPMFGGDAKSHEAVSRTPGSFAQTVEGLRNLRASRRPGQVVEIRIIMTKLQARFLDGLLDFLVAECAWVDRVVFLYEEIEGFAEMYKDRLLFTQSECAAHIDRNFDKLAAFADVRLYHFSLCTVPPRLWPRVWRTLAGFKVAWLDGCRVACAHREQCVGVHRSYLKHAGAPDIKPFASALPVTLTDDPYHPIASYDGGTVPA